MFSKKEISTIKRLRKEGYNIDQIKRMCHNEFGRTPSNGTIHNHTAHIKPRVIHRYISGYISDVQLTQLHLFNTVEIPMGAITIILQHESCKPKDEKQELKDRVKFLEEKITRLEQSKYGTPTPISTPAEC